jgi:hypothetical protein
MTEPTLEEMKKAVLIVYPSAQSKPDYSGSPSADNVIFNCDEHGRDLGVLSDGFLSENDAWRDAYSRLPKKPAPESEDEAFERWWGAEGMVASEIRNSHGSAKLAWDARARLSAGGK